MFTENSQADRALVDEVLRGDREAIRRLIDALSPVIRTRVLRTARRAGRSDQQLRHMGEDLSQEVFVALFKDGGRALRAWAPGRGLSLCGYVGLLSEHLATSMLRSGRKSGWREESTEASIIEHVAGCGESSARLDARDALQRLFDRLPRALSPRGLQLFRLLFVEERSIDELSIAMQMTSGALYTWRARLVRVVTQVAAELERGASQR